MTDVVRNAVVEALILASPEPLAARKIAEVVEDLTTGKVAQTVAELNNRYMLAGAAYRIREIAGGYQLYIVPEFTSYVEEMFSRRRKMRLTRAALEALAIIAYRQPVTRSEIEHIRGVASDGVIHNLLEKKVITIKGRAATVGKPLQYGTTREFLKLFGLDSLDDLPRMSEIEELISSRESLPQTELELGGGNGNRHDGIKLNVVDGTYDPSRKIEFDEIIDMPLTSGASSANTDPDPAPTNDSEVGTADSDQTEQTQMDMTVDGNAERNRS